MFHLFVHQLLGPSLRPSFNCYAHLWNSSDKLVQGRILCWCQSIAIPIIKSDVIRPTFQAFRDVTCGCLPPIYIKAVYQQNVLILDTVRTFKIGLDAARNKDVVFQQWDKTDGFYKNSKKRTPDASVFAANCVKLNEKRKIFHDFIPSWFFSFRKIMINKNYYFISQKS